MSILSGFFTILSVTGTLYLLGWAANQAFRPKAIAFAIATTMLLIIGDFLILFTLVSQHEELLIPAWTLWTLVLVGVSKLADFVAHRRRNY
jgi:hypothetical protein